MLEIGIRRGNPADLIIAAELRWRWIVEENRTLGTFDRSTFLDHFVAWGQAHQESHRFFLAQTGKEIVGMAWLALTHRVPSPRSLTRMSGDIQSVYVVAESRNCGIGALLLDAIVDEATELGIERLVVHSSEGAVTAYDRAGFRPSDLLRQLTLSSIR